MHGLSIAISCLSPHGNPLLIVTFWKDVCVMRSKVKVTKVKLTHPETTFQVLHPLFGYCEFIFEPILILLQMAAIGGDTCVKRSKVNVLEVKYQGWLSSLQLKIYPGGGIPVYAVASCSTCLKIACFFWGGLDIKRVKVCDIYFGKIFVFWTK